jgi:PadR family transcriptional regulator PadR
MKKMKLGYKARMDKAGLKMLSTIFEVYILWLFSKKKMHGYELIKILSSDHVKGAGPKITSATVYPLLNSMTKRGLLSYRKQSTGKRVRKIYSVTPKGLKKLKEAKKLFFQTGMRKEFFEEMLK